MKPITDRNTALLGVLVTLGILVVFFAIQLLTVTIAKDMVHIEVTTNSGFILSLSVLISAPICLMLVWTYLRTGLLSGSNILNSLRATPISPIKTFAYTLCVLTLQVAVSYTLIKLGREPNQFAADTYLSSHIPALYIIAVAFVAPLFEEVLFRGLLFGYLSEVFSPTLSAIVSSALWAIIHTQYGLPEMAYIFALGLLLCHARHKTGSISMPFAIHAINNTLTILLVMLALSLT